MGHFVNFSCVASRIGVELVYQIGVRARVPWSSQATNPNRPTPSRLGCAISNSATCCARVSRTMNSRPADRKSVVKGKSVSERVDLGGGRVIKKKKTNKHK